METEGEMDALKDADGLLETEGEAVGLGDADVIISGMISSLHSIK